MSTYTLTITFELDDDVTQERELETVNVATNRACAALESSPGVAFVSADLDEA